MPDDCPDPESLEYFTGGTRRGRRKLNSLIDEVKKQAQDCLDAEAPKPPVVGACCAPDGTCSVTTKAACEASVVDTIPGSYQGDGTSCTPNPCGEGACCYASSGSCYIQTEAWCVDDCGGTCEGGIYQGLGTSCDPNPCDGGGGGGDCCEYPWPDPDGLAGGPFYPADDLPTVVETTGGPTPGTYTRSSGSYVFYNGAAYITPVYGGVGAYGWTFTGETGGSYSGYPCLIHAARAPGAGDDHVCTDQFSDTYVVSATGGGADPGTGFADVTVTRVSAGGCRWEGTNGDGDTAYIEYDAGSFLWSGGAAYSTPYSMITLNRKEPATESQSSPAGLYTTYDDGFHFSVS